jgi:predicted CopG family antitoxin
MATKTVALDEDAYRLLKERKRESETFSDVVRRVVRPRRPLTDFVGIWKEVPSPEFEAFQRLRDEMRRTEVARQGAPRRGRRRK